MNKVLMPMRWFCRQNAWIIFLSTTVFTLVQLWGSLPNATIFNYRPTDAQFFWIGVLSAATLLIGYFLEKGNSYYKYKDLEESCGNQIDFYKDLLKTSRVKDLEEHLQRLYTSLGFDHAGRVCVYLYNQDTDDFYCVARYSRHPTLNAKSTRKTYPSNSGVIGHVWKKQEHGGFMLDNDIPEYSRKPKEYLKCMRDRYDIPKDIAKDFRMKAVSILGRTIFDTKDKLVGVLICESQTPNKIQEAAFLEAYQGTEEVVLRQHIEKLVNPVGPSKETARKLGY